MDGRGAIKSLQQRQTAEEVSALRLLLGPGLAVGQNMGEWGGSPVRQAVEGTMGVHMPALNTRFYCTAHTRFDQFSPAIVGQGKKESMWTGEPVLPVADWSATEAPLGSETAVCPVPRRPLVQGGGQMGGAPAPAARCLGLLVPTGPAPGVELGW
jgi:hypothetical protein